MHACTSLRAFHNSVGYFARSDWSDFCNWIGLHCTVKMSTTTCKARDKIFTWQNITCKAIKRNSGINKRVWHLPYVSKRHCMGSHLVIYGWWYLVPHWPRTTGQVFKRRWPAMILTNPTTPLQYQHPLSVNWTHLTCLVLLLLNASQRLRPTTPVGPAPPGCNTPRRVGPSLCACNLPRSWRNFEAMSSSALVGPTVALI